MTIFWIGFKKSDWCWYKQKKLGKRVHETKKKEKERGGNVEEGWDTVEFSV